MTDHDHYRCSQGGQGDYFGDESGTLCRWRITILAEQGINLAAIARILELEDALTRQAIRWEPYRLEGPDGACVEPVAVYFAELQAISKSATTIRSYGLDLLRWWRFLWALELEWDRVTRADGRGFARWMRTPTSRSECTGGIVARLSLNCQAREYVRARECRT